MMRYLGRVAGNGVLFHNGDEIAYATYDLEGFRASRHRHEFRGNHAAADHSQIDLRNARRSIAHGRGPIAGLEILREGASLRGRRRPSRGDRRLAETSAEWRGQTTSKPALATLEA